ncbi:MAG: PhoX family protein [Actinomycetota bacterium]|nr:PhoX family protein [Actinomycetota bacterium]
MNVLDRRAFLGQGAKVAGAGLFSVAAVERLEARAALAKQGSGKSGEGDGYGPVSAVAESGSDGREILALPAGFSYVVFGKIGSIMSDGVPTPLALDGMAAFQGLGGQVRLIRNHEDRNPSGTGSVPPDPGAYDSTARGGTSTLDFDTGSRTLVRDFVSLSGTIVNCAGGHGLRFKSWISGEETTAGPERPPGSSFFPKRHGYNFEVPLDRGPSDAAIAEPLVPMGRFAHEALATDQSTGIVYQTEDGGSGQGSGFYRYIPDDPENLAAGGRLQMLAVDRRPQADLREGQEVNRNLHVTWVDIDDVDPAYTTNNDPNSVFNQGYSKGGALFNRLEGCWYDGKDGIFFASTSGGDVKNGDVNSDGYREGFGQIWEYRANGRSGDGRLRLVYESTGSEALDSPDNLCVTPRGGLILCEDDASDDADTNPAAPGIEDVNRLIGFSRQGEVFEFAVNRLNNSEFAGATFSPDGQTLFVNIFGESRFTAEPNEGMTIAINGPWDKGPL